MKPRTIEEWMRDKERLDTPAGRRQRALVPSKFRTMGWRDYDEDAYTPEGESLKEILRNYADEWSPQTREGIVVLGAAGYGKTTGMALLAGDLIDAGAWVRWVNMGDLIKRRQHLFTLNRIAEENDDWSDHEREELALRWIQRDCDVLFLDDVGKEYRAKSGWSDSELENLLRGRSEASKVTMITSNLQLKEWKQYNESMVSFLKEVGEVVVLSKGVDHRDAVAPDSIRARRRAGR